MSYFEVIDRDGPARIGELKINGKKFESPGFIDLNLDLVEGGGTWSFSGFNKGKDAHILPSKKTPSCAPKYVARYFSKENIKIADSANDDNFYIPIISGGRFPSERTREITKLDNFDVLLVDCLKQLRFDQKLIETIISIREKSRENTSIYAPGICTPSKLALLVYMGFDFFDTSWASISAEFGLYFTLSEEIKYKYLDYLPCFCEVCSKTNLKELSELNQSKRKEIIEKHNINLLNSEIRRIKEAIKKSQIRKLVEERASSNINSASALRKLDRFKEGYLEERTPVFKRRSLIASSPFSINRMEIKRFINRVEKRFNPPREDVLTILPCSAKKPYSTSKSHKIFERGIKSRGEEIIITSPLGVVPREIEMIYPAQHYDISVIGVWTEDEKERIRRCLDSYIDKKSYRKIIVHVNNELKKICNDVLKDKNIDLVFTSEGTDPRSKKAINQLDEELNGFETRENPYLDVFKGILDYQFGPKAGDLGSLGNLHIKGNYPKLKLLNDNNDQIATLVPQYGSLAFTIDAAQKIIPPDYRVKIDKFHPKGSVLAPGVVNSGTKIRPNDEVFFEGEKSIGVGRAKMGSSEMMESNRGISIKVRHSKKR